MKRCFALVLLVMLILSLAACGAAGQAADPESESSSSPSSESVAVAAPSLPPEGGEKPLYFSLGPEGEVKALYTGDTLGNWTLEGYYAVWDTMPDGLPAVYDAFFDAPADAPIELHCEVYLSPMASEERVYFFDVMLEDYGKLPVMEGTNARLWFGSGASDALGALEALEPDDRWDCRVAVSRYDYCHLAMQAYDLADIAWIEVNSTAVEPPVPDGRPSGPFLSEDGMILPPPVPHGLALDGIDFSKLDKIGIISLLRPVLERAEFFCQFGRVWYPATTDLITDENREAAILWPYDGMDLDYHPFLNLSYRTVGELRQDMLTVFTPENFDLDLKFIFEGLTDHQGRLYYVGIINGFLPQRKWEPEKLEIVSAEKDKLTVTVPVSWPATPADTWGPAQEPFAATLTFEIRDGYIVVDNSYFAKDAS